METEGISSKDFSLYRASIFEKRETAWTKLKTTQIDKDSTYTYFESNSPGFSPFVIIAKRPGGFERLIEGISSLSSLVTKTSQDKSQETPETSESSAAGENTITSLLTAVLFLGLPASDENPRWTPTLILFGIVVTLYLKLYLMKKNK